MSILATFSNRRQQTVSVPKYSLKNWAIIISNMQLIQRHILAFQKYSKWPDIAPLSSTGLSIY